MVTTPSKSISLEEFLALPETKPASEYIDGKNYSKTNAKRRTQHDTSRVNHCS